MENQKNNRGVIALLIVIIVILSVLCVLFATETISFKYNDVDTNEKNDNVADNNQTNQNANENNITNNEENENYLKFVIDNENNTNICHNINGKNYYSYDKNYAVIINNISIKGSNYTYKYEENHTNRTIKVYLNNNIAFEGGSGKSVLVDVCNYGNYIVYSTGWEGTPYYRIINVEGKEVMSFIGKKVIYSNGILSVEERNRNDEDDELIKYQLNMNSEVLKRENLTTEKYVCDPNAAYDC